jgi:hypothetical protein
MTHLLPQAAAGGRASEAMEAAAIFPDTPDTSDQEQEAERGPELVAQVKKNSFVVSEALKPGTKTQAGALFILSRSKKAFQCKWCILGQGNLRWFNEDTSLAIPKETILLSNIFSVTKKAEKHIGPSQQDLFCFDLSALNSKGKFQAYLLGAQTAQERWVRWCRGVSVPWQGDLAGEAGAVPQLPAGDLQHGALLPAGLGLHQAR